MNQNTPVEKYTLKGKTILVKRDDLVGDNDILPPWGKMTGIDALLEKHINPKYPLIHLAVNGSWSGWALSELCKRRGIKFIYAYAPSKTYSQFILDKARANKCEFYELKPNMMAILYAQVKKYARQNDIQMLPYAFDHQDYRNDLKIRATETFKEHLVDHLVISAGSGVTSSGIVEAFNPGNDLFSNSNRQAHIITVSNISTIDSKFKKDYHMTSDSIKVYKTQYAFEDMMADYEVPFPCNGTWDRKAWWWLEQNIEQLEGDILFWNIGGNI